VIAEHQHPAIVADRIDRAASTGREFTANDIRAQLPDETLAWIDSNRSVFGNCFLSAKSRGTIRRTGWRISDRHQSHNRTVTTWEGVRP
jgi:hypothetical protein